MGVEGIDRFFSRNEPQSRETEANTQEMNAKIAFPLVLFNENQLDEVESYGWSDRPVRIRVDGSICIAVPLREMKRVCDILGEEVSRVQKIRTDYEGIYLAVMNNRRSHTCRETSLQQWMTGYFSAPLPHELPEIRSDVMRADPERISSEDSVFRSHLQGNSERSVTPIRETGFVPTHRSGAESYFIAPMPFDDGGGARQIITPSSGAREETLDREHYISMCVGETYRGQIKQTEAKIKELSSGVERLQHTLVTSLRALEEEQIYLGKLTNNEDDSGPERFGKEFDTLGEHPDIENIKVAYNTIEVYTKSISIKIKNTTLGLENACAIGRFRIVINCDGSRGGVRIFNLTKTVDGYHHPHVDREGVPCLGNIKEAVPHLIAERQYAALIFVCIQYLKTYTRESNYGPYCNIERWYGEDNKKYIYN